MTKFKACAKHIALVNIIEETIAMNWAIYDSEF